MFERYSESARRALFFSLQEARERGSLFIQTEHLLLGVIRVADNITNKIVSSAGLSIDAVKTELGEPKPPVPLSIEIPFHTATKRVFQYAADEAPEHIPHPFHWQHVGLGSRFNARQAAASE